MSSEENSKKRLWNAQYIILLFLGTLTATSFSMVMPTIAKYATQLGASLTVAGIIAGLFSITALIARPFGGVIVDRLNKKKVLACATTVLGLAAMGYSVSVSIPLLVVFRILHGIGFAVSSTANVALVTSFIPRKRLGEGIGYYGLGQILAGAIGPNIGLIIGNKYGLRFSFLISSIILLTAAALMTRISYKPPVNIESIEKSHKGRIAFCNIVAVEVLPLALIGGIFSFGNGIVSSFLVLLGEERGIKNIALYFTVNAICLFIVRPMAGKIADKKSLSFILYPALILSTMEALLLSNAKVLWMVLIAAVCKAFGQGAAQPTLQSTCIKKLPPSRSGVATSTFFLGADIGQGIGPIIGGAISASFGYSAMFYCCVGLLIIGMAAYNVYDRSEKYLLSCEGE
jgi:MFS family permease